MRVTRMPTCNPRRIALALVLPLAAACDDAPTAIPGPSPAPGPVVTPGVPVRLDVPTYDGSGQAVHPDVVVFAAPWRGATHWMAVTPYPNGHAGYENPSLLASDDGLRWRVPDGVANPIVPPPAGGHNSDPDLVHDPAGDRLIMVWREVRGGNVLRTSASADGRRWSAPTTLLAVPSHEALSPAVVLAAGRPMLWYVDAGRAGCSATHSTVRLRTAERADALLPAAPGEGWSPAREARLSIPGAVVWHLDVAHLPGRGEYWAVVHAYARGAGCGSGDLYLARSRDGITWAADAAPFLRAAGRDWSAASLYRTALVPDERRGVLRLWLSARSVAGRWSLGYVELAIGPDAPLV